MSKQNISTVSLYEINQRVRLFVSVELPPEVINEVIRIQKELTKQNLFEGTFVKPENLHITLAFFGSVESKEIPCIQKQLATISFPACQILLKELGVNSPRKPRVLWITVEAPVLIQLAQRINDLFPNYREQRPFNGHITIARMKKVLDKEMVKIACKTMAVAPYSWHASEFSLWQSQTVSTGPIYTMLASFPLKKKPA